MQEEQNILSPPFKELQEENVYGLRCCQEEERGGPEWEQEGGVLKRREISFGLVETDHKNTNGRKGEMKKREGGRISATSGMTARGRGGGGEEEWRWEESWEFSWD